jgi:hypothetical protein
MTPSPTAEERLRKKDAIRISLQYFQDEDAFIEFS